MARYLSKSDLKVAQTCPTKLYYKKSRYASLPPLEINGTMVSVAEGTGAIRAYEAMVYGIERNEPATREKWKRLLLQYAAVLQAGFAFDVHGLGTLEEGVPNKLIVKS